MGAVKSTRAVKGMVTMSVDWGASLHRVVTAATEEVKFDQRPEEVSQMEEKANIMNVVFSEFRGVKQSFLTPL